MRWGGRGLRVWSILKVLARDWGFKAQGVEVGLGAFI